MVGLSPDAIIGGVINGFCLGGTYILIGLGLTLILSIMNIMQFAHGEIYMLGAYTVYYLTVMNEVPIYVAIIISMVVTGLIGLLLEKFLLRPLKGKLLSYVCATTGLSLILQTAMVLTFSLALKQLPSLWPGTWDLSGIYISKERFASVIIALVMCVSLYLFLKQSKYGLAIIASAQSRDGALMQGINPNTMSALVVCIGSALAAVGGALGGGIFNVDPYMGGTAFIKGMTLIILGGLGSVGGAVIGGLILGISEAVIGMFFGSQMVVIIPLILVIAILIWRPKGLFGHD